MKGSKEDQENEEEDDGKELLRDSWDLKYMQVSCNQGKYEDRNGGWRRIKFEVGSINLDGRN